MGHPIRQTEPPTPPPAMTPERRERLLRLLDRWRAEDAAGGLAGEPEWDPDELFPPDRPR
ncbi:MAG: hypothetical protein U0324_42155 [Polyangiales bacterium]